MLLANMDNLNDLENLLKNVFKIFKIVYAHISFKII